jgi:ferredoxin
MPQLIFQPLNVSVDVAPNTKILVAANRQKVSMRYGCAACRCGTCGVKVAGGELTPMRDEERALLQRMGLALDGSVRLACQARVVDGTTVVDLDFQDTYSPDDGPADGGDEP